MALITISRLTLREAGRRRLLLAVALLTLVIIGLTGWGFSRLPSLRCGGHPCPHYEIRSAGAGLLILVAYMFSFVIAVGASFLAAPTIAGDIESHVLLSMLPRPIRRSDVVLGKWLGLGLLLAGYTIGACALEFLAMRLATGYVPPHPWFATVYIIGEGLALMTLVLLASTRLPAIACGIAAFLLFGLVWMGGIAGAIGAAFNNTPIADIGTVSSLLLPTDGLWRGAVYNLEPAAMIVASTSSRAASGNPFSASAPPTTAYILWSAGWGIVVLALAVRSFAQREL